MKKIVALLLLVCLVFTAVACSKEEKKTETAEVKTEVKTEAKTEEPEQKPDTEKGEGVMTYAEYAAAKVDDKVVIEAYVQAKESWWDNKATVYTQDADGGYFLYDMPCSEEDYQKLVPGTKLKVTGYKAEWSGEVEIVDAEFEIEEGKYIAPATDVTSLLGTDELITKQNMLVSFKDVTVEASNAEGAAFLYNWDGSGAEGDDVYFKISSNGNSFSFDVRKYLCDKDTDVYKAAQNLKVGDIVDLEGFLYWYEGPQARITAITVK